MSSSSSMPDVLTIIPVETTSDSSTKTLTPALSTESTSSFSYGLSILSSQSSTSFFTSTIPNSSSSTSSTLAVSHSSVDSSSGQSGSSSAQEVSPTSSSSSESIVNISQPASPATSQPTQATAVISPGTGGGLQASASTTSEAVLPSTVPLVSLTTARNSSSTMSNALGSAVSILSSSAGPLTPTFHALSSTFSSSVSSVSRFTLNNTSSIMPLATTISELSSLAASAGFQSESQTTVISIAVSSIATSTPTVYPSSTSLITSLASTPTITHIPTTLAPSLATGTSISPAQFSSNLAEAQGYNSLFSTLNFSSPCTSNDIACISGNVGNCNAAGSFVIAKVCSAGTECFAMPMNNTIGVVVECTDKAEAANVLGSSRVTNPASVDGQTTSIGSVTLGKPSSSPAVITISPVSIPSPSNPTPAPGITTSPVESSTSQNVVSEITISFQAPTTSTLVPDPGLTTESTSPSPPILGTITTTVQSHPRSTAFVTITEPNSQAPSLESAASVSSLQEPEPTPSPLFSSAISGGPGSAGDGLTIIPISSASGDKETVFITVTKTVKEKETVTATITQTVAA